MADNLLIDPTGLGSYGLLNGQIDPSQFQQQQQNAGLLGFSQGLLSASGASRLPVTFGAALGAGMQGMQQARSDYAKQALTGAQTGYTLANTSKIGLEGQVLKQQLANQQGFNDSLMKIVNRFGSAAQPPGASTTGGIAAPSADDGTAQASGAPTVSSYTADATLPREARALLDSIAGPESSGAYDVRYTPKGGATFQGFDAHPNIPEPGPAGPSTAAGRYQIVKSTWDPLAEKTGLTDFSPVSQDQGAWHLAQETYQGRTGRDLLGDLQAGRTQDVVGALRDQWPTIGKAIGSYASNLQKYTAGGAAVGQSGQANDLPGVPDFAGMMTGNQGSSYAPQGAPTVADGDNGKPFVPTSGRAQGNLDPRFINPDTGRPSIPPNIPVNSQGMPYSPTLAGGAGNVSPAVVRGFEQANASPSDAAYQQYAKSGGTDSQDVWAARNAPMYRQTAGQPSPQGAPATSAMTPATSAYAQYAQNGGKDTPQVWAQRNAPMYVQQPKAANAVPPVLSPQEMVVLEAQSALAGPAAAGQAKAVRDYAYPEAGYYRGVDGQLHPIQGGEKDPATIAKATEAKAGAEYPYKIGEAQAGQAERGRQARETAAAAADIETNPYRFNYQPPGQGKTGPGISEPVQGPGGSLIPPINDAAPITGSKKSLEGEQANWKTTEEQWNKALPATQIGIQRSMAIADALKQVWSGAYTTDFADFRAKLRAIGVDIPALPDPGQVQTILKQNFGASIEQLKSTGISRWTQAELFSAMKNFANPDLQPEANARILGQAIGALNWEANKIQSWGSAKSLGWRDPNDYENKWMQRNPLQPYVSKWEDQVSQGMAGIKAPGSVASAPQQSAAPPITATGPNGHQIMKQNGVWVDAVTKQPLPTTAPLAR